MSAQGPNAGNGQAARAHASGVPYGQYWAEKVAIVLATAVLLLTLLIGLFWRRYAAYLARYLNQRLPPSARLSALWPRLKDGDLVLTVGTPHLFVNSILYCGLYSHGGVVVMHGGTPHVAEAHGGLAGTPQGERGGGSKLVPLARFLRDYQGVVCVARLARPLAPAAAARLRRRAAERWPFLGAGKGGWGRAALQRLLMGRPDATRHCFEWAAELLTAAGVQAAGEPPLTARWSVGQAEAVIALAEERPILVGGNRYLPPVRLENDLCRG